MKTLVIAENNGIWLAEHLGCTLFCFDSKKEAGNGIVTQVDQVDPAVWDASIDLTGRALSGIAKNYGSGPLAIRMAEDPNYAVTIVEGVGLKVDDGQSEGVKVGVMGWWENGMWHGKRLAVIEQMGFMNRDLGVLCAKPQCVAVTPIPSTCSLVTESLDKMESILGDYAGPVCMRLTVTSKDVLVRYAKMGFEVSWLATALELQRGNLLETPFNFADNAAVGTLISFPAYPYANHLSPSQYNIQINPQATKHARWLDVHKKDDKYYATGGMAFYATAWGPHDGEHGVFTAARMRVYRSLRGITAQDMQYRTDASSRADVAISDLSSMGRI